METMRTFSILTLGCKVNQYESAQIRQFLEEMGLFLVKSNEKPDLFVINTCCVTATAAAKSRQYIQRAKKLNEKAKLAICGCLAAQQPPRKGQAGELRPMNDNATHLIANKSMLAFELTQIAGGPRSGNSLTNSVTANIANHPLIKPESDTKINTSAVLTSLPKLPLLTSFKEQTRAFLKVQDGCDGVCSYCIIPKIRSEVQSKPIFEALMEAKALVSAGHKEIVVTGVNLGAYGRESVRKAEGRGQKTEDRGQKTEDRGQKTEDRGQKTENGGQRTEDGEQRTLNIERPTLNNEALPGLLVSLAKVEGLRRIRVSSLEPGDINERLLDVFCDHKNIMPHIHLSVQSGSDNILRRMCRQYGAAELREKIELIKGRLDRPAITCDMIVGFPGETEEDFQATVELAKWTGFSKMHIFGFSLREGTAAAKMKGKVDSKIIKKRAEILRKLGEELAFNFREQFVGETAEVLLENENPLSGRCERYFMVYLDPLLQNQSSWVPAKDMRGSLLRYEKNEIVRVKITEVTEEGATAEEIKD
jgi:threonylcarbamoyladenosine tRNA methylthiotransferase MtaB